MYHLLKHSETLHAHTVRLTNSSDGHNKQFIPLNSIARLLFSLDTLVFADRWTAAFTGHSVAKVVSHRHLNSTGLASVPGQPTWDSWWTEWCCDSFSPITSFFPVRMIPPLLHTCLHRNTAHMRRTTRQGFGACRQRSVLVNVGERWVGEYCYVQVVMD